MAHFARLDNNNVVVEVNVVDNAVLDPLDEEGSGVAFLANWSGGHSYWKQCSYNGSIRGRFPGPGFRYDPDADVFVAVQPFPSWVLDSNCEWQPPTPKPAQDEWIWDEATLSWVQAIP